MFVEHINSPADLKKLDSAQRIELAAEIREALLKRASKHSGHFGPDFGVVEATIALHYVFNAPQDKIVWDISHQTYIHKILTGRAYGFIDESRYDEVSGFSSPAESEYDLFEVGHTSTSLSLAAGLVKGRDVMGGKENVIAFIGDGAMSGGEALEGLNVAGEIDTNFIIIFNDNQMSIAENHGGMYPQFDALRASDGTAPNNLFKAMGLDYMYVDNGNDIDTLIDVFEQVKDIDHPIVVHINTVKGLGYDRALEDKETYHWRPAFDTETGELIHPHTGESYDEITGDYLEKLIEKDSSTLVIASGVPTALGFHPARRVKAGKNYIDVGIAEETAVALASGAAKRGAKVVYGTAATFLQRTYDQLAQDLATNHNPATIISTSASVWGMNDFTHIGFYDLAMMSNIPALRMLAPTTVEEYLAMLDWSVHQTEHPVILRRPEGKLRHSPAGARIRTDYSEVSFEVTQKGEKVAVIALGSFYALGVETAEHISERFGFTPTVVNPLFASDIDTALLDELASTHDVIVTLEDSILEGGFGSKIATYLGARDVKVAAYGIKKDLYDRYDARELMLDNRLDPEMICDDVAQLISI